MMSSRQRREGEPVAVAFGAAAEPGRLLVGLLLLHERPPERLTFNDVSYGVPAALQAGRIPTAHRNITLEESQ